MAREVIRQELSDGNVRLQVLQDAYNRLHMLLETRAKDPTMAGVPGGSTGLLVRHYRSRNRVPVYKVDIQLVQELRLILRQAAEETGDICPAGRRRRRE